MSGEPAAAVSPQVLGSASKALRLGREGGAGFPCTVCSEEGSGFSVPSAGVKSAGQRFTYTRQARSPVRIDAGFKAGVRRG